MGYAVRLTHWSWGCTTWMDEFVWFMVAVAVPEREKWWRPAMILQAGRFQFKMGFLFDLNPTWIEDSGAVWCWLCDREHLPDRHAKPT